MNFFKPKFWDKTGVSFFSIMLLPVTQIIIFFGFLKNLLTKRHKYSIPVICVGNIYLGGTGKTPLCIKIFSILKEINLKPAFVRKEYNLFNDEVKLQENVGPVYQDKKRNNAIKNAIENGVDAVILDDGFQDLSVEKNLSIVCFNEKLWVGNGFTIPSGPLREKLSALKRADFAVINGEKNTNIENKIHNENNKIKIFYTKYKPVNINDFKEKKVIAFAGIGNPENFFNLLKDNNIKIFEEIKFTDHHKYSENELENLIIKAKNNNAHLVTTEKDFLRISVEYKKKINYLKIEVKIENQTQFIEEIKKII